VQVSAGLEQTVSRATIDISGAASRRWDAIVIGAGPAGALASRQMAAAGATILLVDRAEFPREKVCGCCVNGASLDVLARCGVRVTGHAPLLSELHLHTSGRSAVVPLRRGVAVPRSVLDAGIVRSAIEAGSAFLPRTSARICSSTGRVLLGADDRTGAAARAVVIADGLGGSALRDLPLFAPGVARASRIGIGAIARAAHIPRGRVLMCVGRRGYVGMVRLDPVGAEPLMDVAAAIDPMFVRQYGSPAAAISAICEEAGAPVNAALHECRPSGTAALTRRRIVEHEHIYVVGDAAGYVEPFTGEGIAWALAGAEALAPIVLERLAGRYRAGAWGDRHRQLIGGRQLACRIVSAALRRPGVVALGVAACSAAPRLAEHVVSSIHREPGLPA
jgi:flavin-dependent dehydrogenase